FRTAGSFFWKSGCPKGSLSRPPRCPKGSLSRPPRCRKGSFPPKSVLVSQRTSTQGSKNRTTAKRSVEGVTKRMGVPRGRKVLAELSHTGRRRETHFSPCAAPRDPREKAAASLKCGDSSPLWDFLSRPFCPERNVQSGDSLPHFKAHPARTNAGREIPKLSE